MIIIALIYAGLAWLVFFRLKWVRWSWVSGTVTVLIGLLIVAAFTGFLNYLAPAGRIAVVGRVVEVTPNVAGQVKEIPVLPNQFINKGALLFQIDPTPFEYKVKELQAQLAAARQNAEQLKANLVAATAEVTADEAQLDFATKRRDDYHRLALSDAGSQFKLQDEQKQVDTSTAQLAAARARETSARLAANSEIDGVNTDVARLTAQLGNAQWELEQATVRAPAEGYVSILTLAVGDRATPVKSVLSFIMVDDIQIVGIFSQNGLQTVRPGASVQFVFANNPMGMYRSTIQEVVHGVGEGQIGTSGTLARVSTFPIATEYPVRIHLPRELDRSMLRLGMSGTATVYAPNSTPFDLFGWVLLWGRALALYL